MTGEQLYQRMQARIDELMADVDPRERHKYTGKLIHAFCEAAYFLAPSALWREFDNAMYTHEYHRHVQLYGTNNPDTLRGIYLDGAVLNEYADMDPRLWPEVIRSLLSDRHELDPRADND